MKKIIYITMLLLTILSLSTPTLNASESVNINNDILSIDVDTETKKTITYSDENGMTNTITIEKLPEKSTRAFASPGRTTGKYTEYKISYGGWAGMYRAQYYIKFDNWKKQIVSSWGHSATFIGRDIYKTIMKITNNKTIASYEIYSRNRFNSSIHNLQARYINGKIHINFLDT